MTDATNDAGHDQLMERCFSATMWLDELGSRDAGAFVDWLIDSIIAALRTDPAIARRAVLAWELAFADLRRQAVFGMTQLIGGCVDRSDCIEIIVTELLENEMGATASLSSSSFHRASDEEECPCPICRGEGGDQREYDGEAL